MAPSRSPSPAPSSSSSQGFADFMEEPASFRPAAPPPTTVPYARRKYGGEGPLLGSSSVEVGLVSGHPLWGHILYPAAIAMSRFLELHSLALLRGENGKGKGKNVLELGAGGGLPGLVAALEGAGQVVISDFPDPSLVNNITKNISINIGALSDTPGVAATHSAGFTWGAPPTPLFEPLSSTTSFDLILLSDLVFNHSQHGALLDSCLALLSPPSPPSHPKPSNDLPAIDLSLESLSTPALICFYSHHRPTKELIAADLGFVTLARAKGWTVRRVWKDDGAGPAFPEDGGDICIRGTVHGWALTRE